MPYLVHYRDKDKRRHIATFIDLESAQACAERVHGVVTDGIGEPIIDARRAGGPETLGCLAEIPGIILAAICLYMFCMLFVKVMG